MRNYTISGSSFNDKGQLVIRIEYKRSFLQRLLGRAAYSASFKTIDRGWTWFDVFTGEQASKQMEHEFYRFCVLFRSIFDHVASNINALHKELSCIALS